MVESNPGESVCEAALRNGIDIEHACEMSCACTTCHVHVREGFAELPEADELKRTSSIKPGEWILIHA